MTLHQFFYLFLLWREQLQQIKTANILNGKYICLLIYIEVSHSGEWSCLALHIFSIPNLYYKLEEDDLMPDYICSAPNTYGMHKCDNLPNYKMDGKVRHWNQLRKFKTKKLYTSPSMFWFFLVFLLFSENIQLRYISKESNSKRMLFDRAGERRWVTSKIRWVIPIGNESFNKYCCTNLNLSVSLCPYQS